MPDYTRVPYRFWVGGHRQLGYFEGVLNQMDRDPDDYWRMAEPLYESAWVHGFLTGIAESIAQNPDREESLLATVQELASKRYLPEDTLSHFAEMLAIRKRLGTFVSIDVEPNSQLEYEAGWQEAIGEEDDESDEDRA